MGGPVVTEALGRIGHPVINAATAQPPLGRPVLLVTNIPTPYRIPLFNELNAQLAAHGISFKVVFAALGYPLRKWSIDMAQCDFPWEVLNSGRLPSRNPESAVFTYSGLGRVLRGNAGALFIVAGFSLATTRVWLRSLFRKTPYLIWSGAINRKGRPDSFLQRCQRRLVVSRACGFVAYGTRAKEYLCSLGAPSSRVSIALNTVDSEYYAQEAGNLRLEREPGEEKRILYVGNLEPGKRVDLLLKSAEILSRSRRDFIVEIVGSGSEEEELKRLTKDLGLGNQVRFFGFLQKREVAGRLAGALCFAFPSEYDIWGLVLVEAMAAGVPCVSSVHAGATCDLIRNGDTGFAVDFSETSNIAGIFADFLDSPEEARRMGLRARRFVLERISISKSAAGFVEMIQKCQIANKLR